MHSLESLSTMFEEIILYHPLNCSPILSCISLRTAKLPDLLDTLMRSMAKQKAIQGFFRSKTCLKNKNWDVFLYVPCAVTLCKCRKLWSRRSTDVHKCLCLDEQQLKLLSLGKVPEKRLWKGRWRWRIFCYLLISQMLVKQRAKATHSSNRFAAAAGLDYSRLKIAYTSVKCKAPC